MFGRLFLARMRAGILQTLVESGGRTLERFETHCSGNITDVSDPFGAKKREPANRVHCLRAIEQCEALFCFQLPRLQASAPKCFATLEPFPLEKCIAFPNQS